MSKKIVFILIIAILLGLGIGFKIVSMAQSEEEMVTYRDLNRLEEKLDRILDLLKEKGDRNKEILARLGQVLSNQQEMKEELYIIKIRASR